MPSHRDYVLPPQRTVHLAPSGDEAVVIVETSRSGEEAMVEVRGASEANALIHALARRFRITLTTTVPTIDDAEEIQIRAVHCARAQCSEVHRFAPADTPCQKCIDAATRILAAHVVAFGGK